MRMCVLRKHSIGTTNLPFEACIAGVQRRGASGDDSLPVVTPPDGCIFQDQQRYGKEEE